MYWGCGIGLGGHTMLGAVYLLVVGARLVTAGLRGEEGGRPSF